MRLQSRHPRISRISIQQDGEGLSWRGLTVSSPEPSDADWVGREHQLGRNVLNQAKPAIFDPAIAKLRRINFLWMDMTP